MTSSVTMQLRRTGRQCMKSALSVRDIWALVEYKVPSLLITRPDVGGTSGGLGGLDALLSISQMPPGVPVACVGVDNARNAAVLAARILSL